MEELAKLFARPTQTDMQTLIVASPPASLTHEEQTRLNSFPDMILLEGNPDQKGVNQTSFVQRTSLLLELTRHNQNRLMFFVFSVFLGLVVFTRICTPLFALTNQLQFGPFAAPQLAGDLVLNDVPDTPDPHILRFAVAQHNFDLVAKGSDEFGDFDLVGKLTPPNKIHLEKIHNNSQLHDVQIMDGELALDSVPIYYAHGTWTRTQAINATKENLQTDGFWDANFYSTNPQPKFKREGILRSPKTIMEYLRYGQGSNANQPNKEAPEDE